MSCVGLKKTPKSRVEVHFIMEPGSITAPNTLLTSISEVLHVPQTWATFTLLYRLAGFMLINEDNLL
jgi:hypothetical protein